MESKFFRIKRIRVLLWRFLPAAFIFISLIILILAHTNNTAALSSRSGVVHFFSPLISVVQAPVFWIKNGFENIKKWTLAYQINEELKLENTDLLKWRALALELQEENKELKSLLKYKTKTKEKHLTASLLIDGGGAFTRSFIVNLGSDDGVTKGMLGFGPNALCARVAQVTESTAQIVPLTDSMSRIPVKVGKDKKNAYLIGDNTDLPYLQFINEHDFAQKDDVVVTSGYMGLYPANLPLGVVTEDLVDESRVSLFEDVNHLSFIHLIDFGLDKNILP